MSSPSFLLDEAQDAARRRDRAPGDCGSGSCPSPAVRCVALSPLPLASPLPHHPCLRPLPLFPACRRSPRLSLRTTGRALPASPLSPARLLPHLSPILRSFHPPCLLACALPAGPSRRRRRSPRPAQDCPRATARCLPEQGDYPPAPHKTGTRGRGRVGRRRRATSQAAPTPESRRRWRRRSPRASAAPGNPAPHGPPRRASRLPTGHNEGCHLVPLPEGAACGAYLRNMLRPSLSTDNHPLPTCKARSLL